MAEEQVKLAELEVQQKGLVAKVQAINIVDAKTEQEAVDTGAEVKKLNARVDKVKKFHTAGLKAEIKKIEAPYKVCADILAALEKNIKQKLIVWNELKLKKQREAQAKAEKAQQKEYERELKKAEKKDLPPPPPPPPVEIKMEKTEGSSVAMRWDCEEQDITKIPAIFQGSQILILDLKKARKLVNAGIREIPGVRIFQKPVVSIGTKEKEEEVDI